ncbi:MAG: CBS domain-containing protein [Desulfobacteraceae bacterium]|nr:CBS domain-containing protein [Desulfobacteraceae bacterium]
MRKKNKAVKAKTIITSHVNADFDAIGAMLAAQKLHPDAIIIFPGSQEKNLRDFFIRSMSYLFNMADPNMIDFSEVTTLVIVDTRQKNRLIGVSQLLENKDIFIEIYDHHPPMEGDIKANVDISKAYGATTTILSQIIEKQQIRLTPEEATVMALGIYEDTGLFTYSSTTKADFIQAAFLLSCGANVNTIANLVVKEIKTEQVTWLNELLNEMNVHRINGLDVNISTISSPSFITDLAAIVQKIMRMENLDIFFAIVLMGTKINIIARNRLPGVDVGKIMSEFGGGGHAYAASARIDNQTLSQVEIILLDKLHQEVKNIQIAKMLMSSPAITVEPCTTCKEAGKTMTRYNVNTLLVVDIKLNSYEGYITRQVVEKLLFHKLGGQPVCEYMDSETHFVSPDADMAEIELKIIEGKQRIIPVIDNTHIKGVITRSDLLHHLVQHNWEISHTQNIVSERQHVKKRHISNLLKKRLAPKTKKLLESISTAGKNLGINLYVVGGFVRDLLLDREIEDIDIVVEGDGIKFAKFYARQQGCRVNTYKKFGTAVIIFPDNFKVDVASARLEYYTTPAALPIVEKSSIKKDLARRDFTINTLALSLSQDDFGTMIDYFGAARDLKDKTIRTLHNLSFVEDPTRVFRAIKFANRFGFNIGKVTSTLIKNAVKINCFKHLSGLRVLSELKQIFGEENPIPAIRTMESYGLEKVLHNQLLITDTTYELFESVNKTLTWHDLLYLDEEYPRWAIYFMAILNRCSYRVCEQICLRLMVPAKEKDLLLGKRYKAENRLNLIEEAFPLTHQELYWGLIHFKTEFILYIMALTKNEAIRKAISNFYTHHRHIKPIVCGKDLLAMGIKPGSVYTKILNLILNEKLDNNLETKRKELNFAIEYARKNKLID